MSFLWKGPWFVFEKHMCTGPGDISGGRNSSRHSLQTLPWHLVLPFQVPPCDRPLWLLKLIPWFWISVANAGSLTQERGALFHPESPSNGFYKGVVHTMLLGAVKHVSSTFTDHKLIWNEPLSSHKIKYQRRTVIMVFCSIVPEGENVIFSCICWLVTWQSQMLGSSQMCGMCVQFKIICISE